MMPADSPYVGYLTFNERKGKGKNDDKRDDTMVFRV